MNLSCLKFDWSRGTTLNPGYLSFQDLLNYLIFLVLLDMRL